MQGYAIFSIVFCLVYVTGVLILIAISTERGRRKAMEPYEYVLIKLDSRTYGLVQRHNYIPAHSLIPRDRIIKISCKTAKEAVDKVTIENKITKKQDIFNITGEEI